MHTRQDLFAEKSTSQKVIARNIDLLIERIIKAKGLLVNGELENDDFQLIKNDCEKRISVMGVELQNISRINKEKAKSLNQAVLQLAQIGVLFRSATIAEKRKLISILLKEKPVLSNELSFATVFNLAIHFIYNIKTFLSDKLSKERFNENDMSNYVKEVVAKIFIVEQRKQINISMKSAKEIVDFLTRFAIFTTEIA